MPGLGHVVHSVDVERLRHHHEVSFQYREEIRALWHDVYYDDCYDSPAYGAMATALQMVQVLLSQWEDLNNHIKVVEDKISGSPPGADISSLRSRRLGESVEYVAWMNRSGLSRPAYDQFSESELAKIKTYDSDFLREVFGVPPGERAWAEKRWRKSVERHIPVSYGELRFGADIDIEVYRIPIELSAGLTASVTEFEDGHLVLDLQVDGEVGVEMRGSLGISVEGGVEGSTTLSYEFSDRSELVAFWEGYRRALMPDMGDAWFLVAGPVVGGSLAVQKNLAEGALFLVRNESLVSAVDKTGVYGELELDFSPAGELDVQAGVGAGYDLVQKNLIGYFYGEGEFELADRVGIDTRFQGELITGPKGTRVKLTGELAGNSSAMVDWMNLRTADELLQAGANIDIDLEVEVGGTFELELDLTDEFQRDAWSKFKRGVLPFGALWEHSQVRVSLYRGFKLDGEMETQRTNFGLGTERRDYVGTLFKKSGYTVPGWTDRGSR